MESNTEYIDRVKNKNLDVIIAHYEIRLSEMINFIQQNNFKLSNGKSISKMQLRRMRKCSLLIEKLGLIFRIKSINKGE